MSSRTNFNPELLPLDPSLIDVHSFLDNMLLAVEKYTELKGKIENSKISTDILLFPLLSQEAVTSTRIEGTQVTIDNYYEAQHEEEEKRNKDVQEAINYRNAINYAIERLKDFPMSSRLFKEMHRILLSKGVRGQNKHPGEFKDRENIIGTRGATRETADFIPPGPEKTVELISNLEKYLNSEQDDNNFLVKIAIIHAQFETIHPFLNGNGRIGRVLIPLFLYYKKKCDYPFFFLSKTLERDQFKYYRFLNETRYEKNWNQWINFFLEACIKQSTDNIDLLDKFNVLYERDRKILLTKHNHIQIDKFLRVLYEFPIISIKNAAVLSGINYPTCRQYMKTLTDAKAIFPEQKKRNTKYYHYDLIQLLR
ncbi:Fic family protein [Sporolactobacillus sp. THM7-7]|nr:Fic family protein [Sporolactobacillus sp. THM7-7]